MHHALRAWAVAAMLLCGSFGFLRAEAPESFRLLARPGLDFAAVLPAPPAAGSMVAAADLEAVLQAQVWRTPAMVAWAQAVDKGRVWDNAEVLGPWFAEARLPRTARFFRAIGKELAPVSAAAKQRFGRPRPTHVDARIRPCIAAPEGSSYPSGHALYFFMEAEVLTEIFPEAREALFQRAHRAAWGRILTGVHFPTDVVGGRLLAKAFVDEIRKSPAFRKEIEACRAEAALHQLKKAG